MTGQSSEHLPETDNPTERDIVLSLTLSFLIRSLSTLLLMLSHNAHCYSQDVLHCYQSSDKVIGACADKVLPCKH